jgi:hypothetical protein
MVMKGSDEGDWLRQRAGKRHYRELLSGDYLVIRPGPSFHLLNPASAQPPSASEHGQSRNDRREAGDHPR